MVSRCQLLRWKLPAPSSQLPAPSFQLEGAEGRRRPSGVSQRPELDGGNWKAASWQLGSGRDLFDANGCLTEPIEQCLVPEGLGWTTWQRPSRRSFSR